jgi:hypothetical protein
MISFHNQKKKFKRSSLVFEFELELEEELEDEYDFLVEYRK